MRWAASGGQRKVNNLRQGVWSAKYGGRGGDDAPATCWVSDIRWAGIVEMLVLFLTAAWSVTCKRVTRRLGGGGCAFRRNRCRVGGGLHHGLP